MSPDLVLLPVVHRLPAADRVHAGQGKNGGNVKIQTIAICVALALGGNTLVVGAPDDDDAANGTDAGSLYIYQRSAAGAVSAGEDR